jgi:DNA polymerase
MQERAAVLSTLYRLKSFGYEYIDPINFNQAATRHLPSDIHTLKKTALNCTLCSLSKSRKNVVFGEGNTDASVMFIGEGPGAVEDDTGRPFVGRSGELLTKMIENVLLIKRSEVFIANIVKCRPPKNRAPTPQEAEVCIPYLFKQIELIDPAVIVALGSTSYKYLTNDSTNISKVRGEVVAFQDRKLIPTFHPSFLLRNPSAKREAFNDMKLVKQLIENL